jgi:hypothetical protein
MIKKHLAVFGLMFGLLVMFANPARANELTSATATADCTGYTLSVNATDLSVGTTYTVSYTFTLTPASGPAITVGPATFMFTATSVTQTGITAPLPPGATEIPWPGGPLTANFTVTGSATLTALILPVPITINGSSSATLTCGGTGCPATQGFWKNHAFPTSVQQSGLTIGGVHYSASDLLTILNEPVGGNAAIALGKQLVAALLNLAAGAKHNATADAAILTAQSLLQANNVNLLTSFVFPGSTLGQALLTQANILDGYNNGDFNTCSEASGLIHP